MTGSNDLAGRGPAENIKAVIVSENLYTVGEDCSGGHTDDDDMHF